MSASPNRYAPTVAPIQPLLWRLEDLAAAVGLDVKTVRDRLADGVIPLQLHKLGSGRTVRVSRIEAEAWAARGCPDSSEWRWPGGGS